MDRSRREDVDRGSRMESQFEPSISTTRSCRVVVVQSQSTGASCWMMFLILLVFTLSANSHVEASASDSRQMTFDGIIKQLSKRGRIRTTLTQSTPALRPTINAIIETSNNNNNSNSRRNNNNNNYGGKRRRNPLREATSVRTVSSVKVKANNAKTIIRNILEFTGSTGFYYGIDPETMIPKGGGSSRKPRPPKIEDSMVLALEELKMIRLEMERMHTEIQQLKRKMVGDDGDESSYYVDDHSSPESKANALRKRRKEAEKLAAEIESWAITILNEGQEDGWTPVECSKMIRGSMNGMERTTAHMKWMVDSRAEKADEDDQVKHPCIKCTSTIDAPLELVCAYLSQPKNSPDYNDVVDNSKDLEEIAPHAKICWGSSPQILFVKPRDFITFCHHRWKSDGTEVIVNQACEHPKYPLKKMEKEGKSCRGYALRGANFISRCSDDPSKTKISIIAHCRPGGGLPEWATKTAVKALAPIEPFRLFHKINEEVLRNQDRIRKHVQEQAEEMSSSPPPPGRSSRPGGFAQIGYACFWPNGGGKEEQVDVSNAEQSSEDREDDRKHGENDFVGGELQNEQR